MKKWSILCVAILGIIVLASCSSNPTGSVASTSTTSAQPSSAAPISSTPTQTLTPQYGGTLEMKIQEPSDLGYPAAMTGTSDVQYASVCLESLMRYDEKLNLVPLLATDWKSDANAKTITLTLRKGVKFQDGSDFNATVCKWNFNEFNAGTRTDLKNIKSIDIIDDYTLKLNLSSFDNTLLSSLAIDPGTMISEKAFEANGGKDWAIKNPVGTGPFQFVSWTKDVSVKWKRYDDYWGGKPYLDGIEMRNSRNSWVCYRPDFSFCQIRSTSSFILCY